MIGMLRWSIEIRMVNMLLGISHLFQYQASPRERYMEQLHHIFAEHKKNPKLTLYFSPTFPWIDYSLFETKKEYSEEKYNYSKEKDHFDSLNQGGICSIHQS